MPLNVDLVRNSLRLKVAARDIDALGAAMEAAPQPAAAAAAAATAASLSLSAAAAAAPQATEAAAGPPAPAPAAAQVAAAHSLLALFHARGCHPLSNLVALPLLVPPLILSTFFAIDNLSMSEPGMATEGK